nr:FxsA family protein [Vibrio sinus]
MFIAIPVIEIAIFIQVGSVIGLWPTAALVLISAFVGASLVRSQGLKMLISVQQRLQRGEIPTQEIFEGVMLAVAGFLLITPGFLTDLMGMILLLPLPRKHLSQYVMKKAEIKMATRGGFNQAPFGKDETGSTYEGEYETKDEQDRDKLNKP